MRVLSDKFTLVEKYFDLLKEAGAYSSEQYLDDNAKNIAPTIKRFSLWGNTLYLTLDKPMFNVNDTVVGANGKRAKVLSTTNHNNGQQKIQLSVNKNFIAGKTDFDVGTQLTLYKPTKTSFQIRPPQKT